MNKSFNSDQVVYFAGISMGISMFSFHSFSLFVLKNLLCSEGTLYQIYPVIHFLIMNNILILLRYNLQKPYNQIPAQALSVQSPLRSKQNSTKAKRCIT